MPVLSDYDIWKTTPPGWADDNPDEDAEYEADLMAMLEAHADDAD